MPHSYRTVLLERHPAGYAVLTLNRPEKLNAIREQTAAEIMHAMEEVEMDRSIVAVILQGSEKAFCTGTDTSGFQYSPGSLFDVYRARRRTRKTGMMQRFVLGRMPFPKH